MMLTCPLLHLPFGTTTNSHAFDNDNDDNNEIFADLGERKG